MDEIANTTTRSRKERRCRYCNCLLYENETFCRKCLRTDKGADEDQE